MTDNETYPKGVTTSDHIAHDIKQGRFPKRSTIEEFLSERPPMTEPGIEAAFVRTLASLAAAISILERTPKAKKAVASDKIFEISLNDYRKALEDGRAALRRPAASSDLRERLRRGHNNSGISPLDCKIALEELDALPGLDEEVIRKDERERCANLTGEETEALKDIANGPWELWTEGRESQIADMVLRSLCARKLASLERLNSTLHKFTITDLGRAALQQQDGRE